MGLSKNLKHLLALVIMFCATLSDARAQQTFPEFSLSDQLEKNVIVNDPSQAQSSIAIRRPLMRDILLLQEQIKIIEALISRQSEIKKIATNYSDIGLPFLQPSPLLSTCQKLPTNLLCLYSYPDLPEHSDFIDKTADRFKMKQEQAMAEAIEKLNIEIQNQRQADSFSDDFVDDVDNISDLMIEEFAEEESYIWSDIQCIQQSCNALLISTLDDSRRFRVNSGDIIGKDIQIIKITPTKIEAKRDDGSFEIKSTMHSKKRKKTAKKQTNVESAFNNALKKNPTQQQVIPQRTVPNTAVNRDISTKSQELLGPTGLF